MLDNFLTWVLVFGLVFGGGHFLVRSVFPGELSQEVKDSVAAAGVRIGALHALVTALSLNMIVGDASELQNTVQSEALALESLYLTLADIEGDDAKVAQESLENYAKLVVSREWALLGEGQVSHEASTAVLLLHRKVDAVMTSTATQLQSASLMRDIQKVEFARGQRSFERYEPTEKVILFIVVLGFLGTWGCFLVFHRGAAVSSAVAIYAAINGAILFSFWVSQFPFSGTGSQSPEPLNIVLERTIASPAE